MTHFPPPPTPRPHRLPGGGVGENHAAGQKPARGTGQDLFCNLCAQKGVAVSLCRCFVESLCRYVVVSLCRCVVVSLSRC